MRKLVLLLTILAVLIATGISIAQEEETFALTIMHTNDTHAAHAPNGDGDGGAAIQAAVINQIRAEVENSILLDAGDRFSGTLFHTVHLGADQVQVMNAMGYDAMALGNHEFDNGDDVLAAFIDGVEFPVLAANLDLTNSAELTGKVLPHAVIEVNGQQIGVIGLVTADTVEIANPGENVIFSADYAPVANAAAAELTEQGVNKIVLLTHTGYGVDETFIANLENIDIVLGGHSHTLFSNQNAGAAGDYPVEFETAAGSVIYYGQSGANTLYLGRMDVEFDAAGMVVSAEGDSIFLSRYITPDETLAAVVADLDEEVVALREQPTGASTDVVLVGNRNVCRIEECPLGNLIADAMRAHTGAQIAIMNSGGIRADVDAGEITAGDLLTVQPFGNLLATFEITGENLIAALENGVSRVVVGEGNVVARSDLSGRFPQVSGIRYTFDPSQEAGSRIVSVEIDNGDGTFSPIDPAATYSVVSNGFVRQGGDGYTVFAESAIAPYDFGAVDWEVTRDYFVSLGTITEDMIAVQGRITMTGATLAPLE
ncbi:MAG: 5'-nucleotidase C-terminal domain-containing protein [Anaerolineae bacterium]|jgi:5'-nucleotidase|nr:5'-nucleotidase C-terminal domain-containing protein [Anaerolineae bacterium]